MYNKYRRKCEIIISTHQYYLSYTGCLDFINDKPGNVFVSHPRIQSKRTKLKTKTMNSRHPNTYSMNWKDTEINKLTFYTITNTSQEMMDIVY